MTSVLNQLEAIEALKFEGYLPAEVPPWRILVEIQKMKNNGNRATSPIESSRPQTSQEAIQPVVELHDPENDNITFSPNEPTHR